MKYIFRLFPDFFDFSEQYTNISGDIKFFMQFIVNFLLPIFIHLFSSFKIL